MGQQSPYDYNWKIQQTCTFLWAWHRCGKSMVPWGNEIPWSARVSIGSIYQWQKFLTKICSQILPKQQNIVQAQPWLHSTPLCGQDRGRGNHGRRAWWSLWYSLKWTYDGWENIKSWLLLVNDGDWFPSTLEDLSQMPWWQSSCASYPS